MLRLLIVDDEPLIRSGIRMAAQSVDDVEVLGECSSGAEAVDSIVRLQPDLVLLDVRMPGCSGFDVVRQVGLQRMPAVIFITAHDEYAVRAFEVNAVDYLLKPFDAERLRDAIGRARVRLASGAAADQSARLQAVVESREYPQRLVVKSGDRFEFVAVEAIEWIESANNYVQLHCGARSYLMGETLSSLEQRLSPARFLRVHRCRIVNVDCLAAVSPSLGGVYLLELKSGVHLTTGRQYRDAIQRLVRG